jgi:hypothetical protein
MNYDSPQFVAAVKKILGRYWHPKTESVPPKDAATRESGKPPENVPLVSDTAPAPECQHETHHCKPDQTPLWKILLETAAVCVGIYVAHVYHGQLVVMQGQLTEIIKQFPEFQKSADAAKSAADAADKSVKTQAKTFNSEQRAWVRPIYTGIDPGHPIVAHVPLAHFFNFENIGKTPALRVEIRGIIELYTFDEVLPLGNYSHDSGLGINRYHLSVLWPQALQESTFQAAKNKYPSRGYLIDNATARLYFSNNVFEAIFGEITYDDIYGHSHWVHFCGTSEFSDTLLKPHDPRLKCLQYNAVDLDPE